MALRFRPSSTAGVIADLRARVLRPPVASGDPDADDRLARSLRKPTRPHLPGMPAYVAARTTFYDEALLRACAAGTGQVVVVGAGYDGRSLRFRRPGVTFFEVDHPTTQADKRERLTSLGIPADDVRFVPVDLGRDSVDDALAAAGHDAGNATHFMCEGLTMYLPMPVLVDLLRALGSRAGPGSTIAIDFIEPGRGRGIVPRLHVGLVRGSTAMLGEPMVTLVAASQAEALLRRTGWAKEESVQLVPSFPVVLASARRL